MSRGLDTELAGLVLFVFLTCIVASLRRETVLRLTTGSGARGGVTGSGFVGVVGLPIGFVGVASFRVCENLPVL